MGYKTVYNCDICRDVVPKEDLLGCCFSDMKRFTLREAHTTQGVHICTGCMDQLRVQLGQKQPPQGPDKP